MALSYRHRRRTAAGLSLALAAWAAAAQTQESTALGPVTVVGHGSSGGASVAGFGNVPSSQAPWDATVFGRAQLDDAGVASIGGLTRLDASVSDAYDAEGYWSIVAVRGYTLDNRYNYRREGLPINAETAIALDNKERVELLQGTSGIQAGTSAPGGLVNLLVKHADTRVRQLRLEARQVGELLAAADIGERFGPEGRYGLRVNAVAERLDPPFRHSRGERSLLALAADWQAGAETLLQAEIESSHQRQPSVTGFSMLGNAVPDARRIDPRTNLNDQPWTQPVVLDGDTASLRWQQGLAPGWRLTVQAQQQRLRSDDRTAFPYGVYDSALYACPQWCDRFAPDGSFTYWQYISDRERRTSSAASATLAGTARSGQVDHAFEVGVLGSTFRGRFQDQVFDIAGTGRIDDSLQTPPSPGGSAANVDRDERSSELFLRDRIALGAAAQLWTGLRHTRLQRSSQLTRPGPDGWEATHYPQSATLPWLALLRPLATSTLAYASWGEGLESEVVPGRALYTNAGQALPALKSRQFELSLKHAAGAFEGSLTLFDIDRPQSADRGACDLSASCTRVIDGSDHHRGIEVAASWRGGHWAWQTSVQGLRAERRGSADPAINGHRPVNVPAASLRLSAEFRVPQQAGLALAASLHADSDRVVLPSDDSVRIPGWARLELGARWRIETGRTSWVWRLGLDNATDRRAWKESPYQFSHVYLYPLAPRTWRSSVEASL